LLVRINEAGAEAKPLRKGPEPEAGASHGLLTCDSLAVLAPIS